MVEGEGVGVEGRPTYKLARRAVRLVAHDGVFQVREVDADLVGAAGVEAQAQKRRFLAEALQRNGANVSKAAEEVGMQRTNFHALMRKYGLTSDIND